jgi:hypothetical protein
MKRYFFDLASPKRREFDFQGCEFANPETAYHQAELLALDLCIEAGGKWSGWSVEVRNILGRQLFAVSVPDSELAVA